MAERPAGSGKSQSAPAGSAENRPQSAARAAAEPAQLARALMRQGRKAVLSTLDRETGAPYGSLVTVATLADGRPILLLSRLARHTQNLAADPRASLLFDGTSNTGDALAGDRVTVIGIIEKLKSASEPAGADNAACLVASARRRFLAKQPEAAFYADFGDFAFYCLQPTRAHLIGGFGRIVELEAKDLLISLVGAENLIAGEDDLTAELNRSFTAVDLQRVLSAAAPEIGEVEGARVIGVDPAGVDIHNGSVDIRVDFPQLAFTAREAKRLFTQLLD